jgi:multicomponent Na+:H+ antiporter subunit B
VNSVVLQTAARILLPIMLLLSVVALIRGHNEPGGGFVGGLLAASGFALYGLAFRVDDARQLLRLSPRLLIGIGLIVAVLSGVPAVLADSPFMTGRWVSIQIPGLTSPLKLGTPLVFDVGVYLVVIGVTLLMVFSLEDSRYGDAPRG